MSADLALLESQYGLPKGILAATSKVESNGNPNAVSSKGARGEFQLMPATSANLGNGSDAEKSARLWAENMKASGGDVDKAAMMYHGGPDTKKWGPLTHAYPGKIAAALPQTNSFLEHIGAGNAAPAAPETNSFLEHIGANAKSPNVANPPVPVAAQQPGPSLPRPGVATTPGGGVGPVAGGNVGTAAAPPGAQPSSGPGIAIPGRGPGGGAGASGIPVRANTGNPVPGMGPNAPLGGNLAPYGASYSELADLPLQLAQGLQNVKQGGLELGARGIDAIAGTHYADDIAKQRAAGKAATARLSNNPNSPMADIGQFGGEMLGTAPLSAARVLTKIPAVAATLGSGGTKAARIAAYLAHIGDSAGQGAISTSMVGNGDVKSNAAMGGSIGAAISAVSPIVGKAASKVSPKIAALVDAVRGHVEPAAPSNTVSDIAAAINPEAIASGGARRGLLSNSTLTPEIKAHVGMLVGQGVPIDQAIREAEAKAIGASPTVPDVTRNFSDAQAVREGAKIATPEGQALMERQTANNAAAHRAVSGLVDNYGGIPAHGEAIQTAAKVMAAASDASRAKVTALYKAAEAAAPGVTVRPDALREVLASTDFQTPKTAAGKAFVSGMRDDLAIATNSVKGGARGLGPRELERMRQAANAAYDASAPAEVNMMVGKVKSAIDQAFDQLGDSSAAYKTARAAHKAWADAYDIPGIADITRRDASGEFKGAWRKLDRGLVSGMDDKPFAAMVGRLKANGNDDAIDKVKASVIQEAYEAASAGAHDSGGHANLNGRVFLKQLDKIGAAKLSALFTQEELGKIASFGRGAMHVNEAAPGVVNNSSTTSALLNAISTAKSAAKKTEGGGEISFKDFAHQLPGLVAGVASGHEALVMGTSLAGAAASKLAAARAGKKATADLASALTQAGDPQTARAADRLRQAALANAMRANQWTQRARNLAAPVAATQGKR